MSKFENEQEKKVREIIKMALDDITIEHSKNFDNFDWLENSDKKIEDLTERVMLRIRPFLIDLEFIRDIYSITEEDDYLYKDMVWNIKDKIEEYFKKRGDAL